MTSTIGNTIRSAVLVMLAACAIGCASGVVRNYASVLSANTNSLNDEIEGLTRSRREIEASRARLAETLDLSSLRAEQYTQRRLAEWAAAATIGDKSAEQRHKLYQSVRAYTDASVGKAAEIDALSQRLFQVSLEAKGQRSEKLAETSKLLATLSQESSLQESLKFLVSFGKEVGEGIKKARAEAETAENAAIAKTKQLETSALASAPPPWVPSQEP